MTKRSEEPTPTAINSALARSSKTVRPRLRPIPAWVIVVGLPVMVLVAVGAVWLLLGTGLDGTRLDAIRTGSTLGVGLGGVLVLWLAIRRQRSTELDLLVKYEAHELAERTAANTLLQQQQEAADAREDAKARRITDLYTKAVEQLGSDKAPVRLGGLYALERLAQDNHDDSRLRQTVVNVWCAYLRMPYTPPTDIPADADGTIDEQGLAIRQERQQEREVRLAAQRVLAAHLRPGSDPARGDDTFWPDITIDLAGATLIDLDFTSCHLVNANFTSAMFVGATSFRHAEFAGEAHFVGAEFAGKASFGWAKFADNAWFAEVKFAGNAEFSMVKFAAIAWFGAARFADDAAFDAVAFGGEVNFGGVAFGGYTKFKEAKFDGDALFEGAEFAGHVWFGDASFKGLVNMMHAWSRPRTGDGMPPLWKVANASGAREGSDGLWSKLIPEDEDPF